MGAEVSPAACKIQDGCTSLFTRELLCGLILASLLCSIHYLKKVGKQRAKENSELLGTAKSLRDFSQ